MNPMKRVPSFLIPLVLAFVAQTLLAQATQTPPPAEPIRDNSFLIEEAYNQDAGVVQHIHTFSRPVSGAGWAFTFTQEWPVGSMRHQLSFTVPVFNAGPGGSGTGVGDAAVHYRYQMLGANGGRLAASPRVSLLLATGDAVRGTGAGGTGIQTMLPVSLAVSPWLVVHANAGLTHTPRAHDVSGDVAAATSYTAGGSAIWLASTTFNVLLESSWNRVAQVIAPGLTSSESQLVIAPGIRWAHNLPGDVQIVPGIAYVVGVGSSRGERSLFVYLSIEHPFQRESLLHAPEQ